MGDPRLAGYLARALNAEFAAVQQYSAQASLTSSWGLKEYSSRFRSDARDELEHVDLLIQQMLNVGIVPNGTQLPPVRLGRSIEEMLLIDRGMEVEVVRLYGEAERYCGRSRRGGLQELFRGLLDDETGHLRDLDELLADVRQRTIEKI